MAYAKWLNIIALNVYKQSFRKRILASTMSCIGVGKKDAVHGCERPKT